jgi:5-methylcytosine-specific restriction endonuclease McrA
MADDHNYHLATTECKMAKRRFSDEESYAVYTVHGERCWLCRKPIDLAGMHIDHIIPELLLDDRVRLAEILHLFGLSESFALNSYQNWMPACMPCNLRKGDRVLHPTPIIQVELQIAAERASRAEALAAERSSQQSVTKAWNTIRRAHPGVELPATVQEAVVLFAEFHAPNREPEVTNAPIHLTRDIHVVEMKVVQGPYGIGAGPVGPGVSDGMRCGSCGSTFFNGARCVMCGEMED